MKSILLSIKPEWVAKILNGEKTIEVRKKFPKDYVGWVYIYCSKGGFPLFEEENSFRDSGKEYGLYAPKINIKEKEKYGYKYLNGKVVARFWCNKVEDIFYNGYYELFMSSYLHDEELCKRSCVSQKYMADYFGTNGGNCGYAIHISKLEIFDKPKKINEFWNCGKQVRKGVFNYSIIHKAPQNYCYIEGEQNGGSTN